LKLIRKGLHGIQAGRNMKRVKHSIAKTPCNPMGRLKNGTQELDPSKLSRVMLACSILKVQSHLSPLTLSNASCENGLN